MQAHFLRYSCEIFTTKTCYVENKTIRLSIEKMRKRRIAMLRMRMCCCRISGGGSSNRLFATGGFIIVPPSYTITSSTSIFPISPFLSSFLSSLVFIIYPILSFTPFPILSLSVLLILAFLYFSPIIPFLSSLSLS